MNALAARRALTKFVEQRVLMVGSPQHLRTVSAYADFTRDNKVRRPVDCERHLVRAERFNGQPLLLVSGWYTKARPIVVGSAIAALTLDVSMFWLGGGLAWFMTLGDSVAPHHTRVIDDYLQMRGQLRRGHLFDDTAKDECE